MSEIVEINPSPTIIANGDTATGILTVNGRTPITVIGTQAIRDGFDAKLPGTVDQFSRMAPGVTEFVLNPDAPSRLRCAPVGCAMVSPTHIYPGPVGVDIKCSMSLLADGYPRRR